MYETGDIGLCPKVARACPNPKNLHISSPDFSEPDIFARYFHVRFVFSIDIGVYDF